MIKLSTEITINISNIKIIIGNRNIESDILLKKMCWKELQIWWVFEFFK